MNIFYIDKNPEIAAMQLVDKHVVKMILEYAQLLSTAHRVLDGVQSVDSSTGRKKKIWVLSDHRENVLYKATHVNHPSAIWARQSNNNYNWLYCHFVATCKEYTHRYGKTHLTESKLLDALKSVPRNIPVDYLTPMPCAMPDEYKISNDPVENYREYYRKSKADLHSWKNRERPDWI